MVILNPSCHGSVHGISCRGDCYSFGDDGDRCSSGNVDHGYHGDDVADVSSGGNVDDGYHGDDGDDVCSGGNVDDGDEVCSVAMLMMVTMVMMVMMLLMYRFPRMALGNYEHVATGFKVWFL